MKKSYVICNSNVRCVRLVVSSHSMKRSRSLTFHAALAHPRQANNLIAYTYDVSEVFAQQAGIAEVVISVGRGYPRDIFS
nr:hypothetical protein [Candidatus Kuenenia stuttgartiensis]